MRQLASTTDQSFKTLTQGMNAATRAAAEMRREIAQSESAAKSATGAHEGLWKSIAGGTAVGNLAANALQAVAGAILDVGKAAVGNAANLESSKIAFTQLTG